MCDRMRVGLGSLPSRTSSAVPGDHIRDRPISSALSVVQDYPRFRRCVVAMETPAQPSPPDVAYNAMFDSGAAQRRFMEEVPFKNLFKCETGSEDRMRL